MAEDAKADKPLEQLREITVALDSYEDIFSDFDPRPYNERELSEDFLKAIHRRYMEGKRGRFELRFTIPAAERDVKEEALIKRRLREHFSFMLRTEQEAVSSTRKRGYAYISLGTAVLLANTFALFVLNEASIIYQILSILLVPAGWYGTFTGIGKVIDDPVEAENRGKLYEKFEHADYIFMSEELE
jgi:hypothetical protein